MDARRSLGASLVGAVIVTLGCGCRTSAASPPRSSPGPAPAPVVHDAGATAPTADDALDAAPPAASNAAATEPVAAEPEDSATPAAFGQPLRPGLYVFPDGLRIRVQQIAGCDFDTSVPCFGGTFRAHATLGKQEATVEWSTRSKVVLRYRIDVTQSDFTVRR